jgi:hypothetical protein
MNCKCVVGIAATIILVAALGAAGESKSADQQTPVTSPLPPEYLIHPDGSVTLRICYNSSCATTEAMTFSASDMAYVREQIAICPDDTLRDRLQRLRIAVWKMEVLAQKHQPILANDRAVNDEEYGIEGRTDCVDNSSNTTTFLRILEDLGDLPGWSVASPQVRHVFDFNLVHWSAVVIDQKSGEPWTVDSWFRPNGHLPIVLPLSDWQNEAIGWAPPFKHLNPYPQYTHELCES